MFFVSELKIEHAKKEQAAMISELIYSTEKDPEAVWGYGSKDEIIKRLTKIVRRTDTRYSYKYTRVAVNNGEVYGALIGLPHSKLNNLDNETGKVIFELQKGFFKKLKWAFRAIIRGSIKESESGEYYIANLATFRFARGKGVGTNLMKDAEKRAEDLGLSKCSLLVDQSKPAVVNLYSNLGYKVKEEVIDEQRYYRMIKPLKVA